MKTIFVTICGAPNAGKSTLINKLVGSKISIVSPKPQTTETNIRGIITEGKTQIIIVDTPGIFKPANKKHKKMVEGAWEGVAEGEVTLLLIDPTNGITENAENIIKNLAGKNAIVAINKSDAVQKLDLLPLAKKLHNFAVFKEIFFISAKTGEGLDELKKYFTQNAKAGEWIYPEDQISDKNDRFMAEEITREKIFYLLRQELPYSVIVETEIFKEQENGSYLIHQLIYTKTKGQKKIIIGDNAQMVKKIGTLARKEMSEVFGVKVQLFLHVKFSEEKSHAME